MTNIIRDLYLQGYSGREVAKMVGMSKSTTLKIIKELGISRPNIQYQDKYGRFNKKGKTSKPQQKLCNTKQTYRRIIKEDSVCEICGKEGFLEVHHIDRNRDNNERDNLQILCPKCHKDQHPRKRDSKGRFIKEVV